ncbi:hypothetical protein [Nostoc sp. PCC 7107]|uniref:hypothetical protein n=1 Tax=Nostoc sp. PCC 7107 TaxID=317936 RepID=UPI00029F19A2|nr:hypothetical protein [Nostoc sp. PCC 7107]AFY44445.1 hypothetical protein Nos7107_3887 [Nostoc sp. PCC 7107]
MTTTTTPNVQIAINVIFEVLSEPSNEWQCQALEQYKNGNVQEAKKTSASHLRDFYCKCLGFLVNATNTNPNLSKVLSAAANAAADHAQVKALDEMSHGHAIAFESTDIVGSVTENILRFLTPITEYHQLALAARNNYDVLKELEQKNSDDHLIKALLYLTKAHSDSPALFTIIAEASTNSALHTRNVGHQKITDAIASAFT